MKHYILQLTYIKALIRGGTFVGQSLLFFSIKTIFDPEDNRARLPPSIWSVMTDLKRLKSGHSIRGRPYRLKQVIRLFQLLTSSDFSR